MEYVNQLINFIKRWSSYFGLANQQIFEEQFYQLLHDKRYDEAIKLAQQHKFLDLDLVYKCKWRNSGITVQSIKNVLGKIQDKLWAINECVKTVPISYEACRTLIDFGLKEANLQLLYQLGKESQVDDGSKHGHKLKFTTRHGGSDELRNLLDDTITDEGIEGLIDFDCLNDRQKELCRCRQNLIRHEHSLYAYESILGDYRTIQQHFDHVFYHEFRQKCPLNNCIYYANDGDAHAVETLLNFYTDDLTAHILPILSNFPETLSPFQYRNLLPHLKKGDVVYEWRNTTGQVKKGDFDWSWKDSSSSILIMIKDVAEEYKKEFYNSNEHLKKYLKPLTPLALTQWFIERALEMESKTLLMTSAIQLLSVGTELNIKNLKETHANLREFNDIVYDCCTDENLYLSYSEFTEMTHLEKLILMTGNSSNNCKDRFRQYVITYMHRREEEKKINHEEKSKLLKDYFLRLAHTREQICKIIYNDLLDRIEDDNFVAEWTKGLDDLIDEIGEEVKVIERDRQSKLLSNLASQTLNMGDYKACYEACECIMKQDFKESWAICCQLGMLKQFTNNEAKYKLLAFALAYCDDPTSKMSAKIINHVVELRKRDNKIQEAYLRLFG